MARALLAGLAGALLLALSAAPASARETFLVTNTDDSGPGSLRQAILDANADALIGSIQFAIPGTGVHTIAPLTALPAITAPTSINAFTQPGASPNTLAVGSNAVIRIQLSGENLTGTEAGLLVTGSGVAVTGLAINRFGGPNIDLQAATNVVAGNYLGTRPGGGTGFTTAETNLGVRSSAANNRIGGTMPADRNLISSHGGSGVQITGAAASGNVVQGNLIGTDAAGTGRLGNRGGGIGIDHASGSVVGGAVAGARNVISANFFAISAFESTNTIVQGNYVGLQADGTSATTISLGNGDGIVIHGGSDTEIGGTTALARNVIGNGGAPGITIRFGSAVVHGNYIGLDASGKVAAPNQFGVNVFGQFGPTEIVTIGGTTAAERNVISGNTRTGVSLGGNAAILAGNYIGTDRSGKVDLGNGDYLGEPGVSVSGAGNVVGGSSPSARNLISGNGGRGVSVAEHARDTQIFSNYIGTDVTGAAVLGNDGNGVVVEKSADTAIGGGSDPGVSPGNVISGNGASGVLIRGFETLTVDTTVAGNAIGTNAAGTSALPNGDNGVQIDNGATGSAVTRNLVSGNRLAGISISGVGTESNFAVANKIGTNKSGSGSIPNGIGVELAGGAASNRVGEAGPATGNLISGNLSAGVLIRGRTTEQNQIVKNLIGTRNDGNAPLPNDRGVVITTGAHTNRVGGTASDTRNLISGNRREGVLLEGQFTSGNEILGNYIGTRMDGTAALGNEVGVAIENGAGSNDVGGTAAGAGNLVSGNRGAGVILSGTDTTLNVVQGNRIGGKGAGPGAVPNGGNGVSIAGSRSTTVGGSSAGANRIVFNLGDGVRVASGNGNAIRLNTLHANGGLGIDLGPDGVTANDPGDGDGGANRLQNFPVITSVTSAGGKTTIRGTLASTPSETFDVDVYRTKSATKAEAEARRYLGSVAVTTGAAGNGSFTLVVDSLFTGHFVRATATRRSTLDTSELSGAKRAL